MGPPDQWALGQAKRNTAQKLREGGHTRGREKTHNRPSPLWTTNSLTAGDRRVVTQFRLHHGLMVGHLEELAGVRLQQDCAALREDLMPVQHDVSIYNPRTGAGWGRRIGTFVLRYYVLCITDKT